jgi:2-methylaconitate cis-trans-isomerase PrpF
MPLMIVRAGDLGLSGREKPAALDANTTLLARLEALRLQAGRMMAWATCPTASSPSPSW